MDNEEHGHIPYVLILLHHLSLWKQSHNNISPQNYSEKRAFRDQVNSSMRTKTPEGSEENFEEAANAVLKTLTPHAPSSAVKEVFSAPECSNLTKDSPTFWLIASAISTFYQTHNVLPLSGGLPDMKAKSADYIALQQLYKAKARSDAAEVKATVASLDKQLKRPVATPEAEIDAFCKSAGYIKLVRGHMPHFAQADERKRWSVGKDRAKAVAMQLSDSFLAKESVFPLYAALIAYDSYAATHQLAAETEMASGSNVQQPADPIPFDNDPEETIAKVMGIAKRFLDAVLDEGGQFIEDPGYTEVKERIEGAVKDLVHARGGELHNIAAVTGGMVAQEAIKVVTKQYVPVDNVCLFDGVHTRVGTLRL